MNKSILAVEFVSVDDITLRGQLWPAGEDWVILVHDAGEDLDAWDDFPAELFGRGFTVLTMELRGHGLSDGPWLAEYADRDVEAALHYAAGHGAFTTTVIGAGVGATAALIAAGRVPVTSLALLSPRATLAGHAEEEMRRCVAPKLIVAGAADTAACEEAERLRALAIGWLLYVNVPGAEHGTALIAGTQATGVRQHILGSLYEHRGYALLERQAAQQGKD
jgi:pimeloyl-ACP methyl ester carboxylesterase